MMTSIGHRGEVQKLKAIGFSAYLTKPVSPEDLYNTLSMILGNSDMIQNEPNNVEILTKFNINERTKANIKVLVVEDNPVNQKVAMGMLKRLGIDASYIAENGQEAIDKLMKYDFDLVFMDMQMPVLDGIETTKMIRGSTSNVLNSKIPIIAMTANAMKGTEEICLNAGMDDYIPKPIKLEQLNEKMLQWLPRLQSNQELQPSEMDEEKAERKIFDKKAMMENLGNSEELINEVLTLFIDNTQTNIDKIETFLSQGDVEQAALVAHAIKGSSGNITSDIMYDIALKLETQCKNNKPEDAGKTFKKLKEAFQWFIDNKDNY
jgi:CheY-like chemotaxis protein/HPt (histidine-containing phosphotransfer) domain-containing protein